MRFQASVGHKQIHTSPNDWIVVRDTHEPIISRELFELAQAARAQAAVKSGAKASYTENILRGRIFCGHCGGHLNRHRDNRQGKYYFSCIAKERISKDACDGGVYVMEQKLFSKYVKFRRGEYQSIICPYGYQKGSNGRMEPDEETAPNVQLIFQLVQNGLDVTQIIEELFTRGIPTPGEYKAAKGRAYNDISRCCGIWGRSTIWTLLRDERYTGTYIMGKRQVVEVGSHRVRIRDESEWIKIPDHHPPIISKELFEQVQAKIPRFKSVKRNHSIFPLRGKVFCGCCHHAMVRTDAKNHSFLPCSTG